MSDTLRNLVNEKVMESSDSDLEELAEELGIDKPEWEVTQTVIYRYTVHGWTEEEAAVHVINNLDIGEGADVVDVETDDPVQV